MKFIFFSGVKSSTYYSDGFYVDSSGVNAMTSGTTIYASCRAVVGSKAYFWAGVYNGGSMVNSGVIYNKTTKVWSSMSAVNAPTARQTCIGTVVVGTKIIFLGGINGGYVFTSGMYETTNDTWTVMPSMPL